MRTRALLLALLVTVPTLAVLANAASPPPALAALAEPACAARLAPLPPCNLWASQMPTGPANEVHVAVNPLDPDHILAVAKDYSLGPSTDCRPSGAYHVGSASYVSFDGGATWSVTRVPAPYSNGGAQPSPLKYKCGSDPVALFGPDGTAYYVLLNFQYTGGRQAAIAVARSPDGGISWPADDIRVLATSGGADKEWGAVGRDGRVHVVWTDVYNGRVYHARTVSSYDDWAVQQVASAGGGNPAVTVDTGPDGEVYVFWRDSSAIKFRKSVDAGATFAPTRVAFTTTPFEQGGAPRLPFMPQLAVDDSPDSPYSGSIYVTWPDRRSGNGDAYFAYSRDGGLTWASPVSVNDDATNKHQVMPQVSVAPNGRVDVAWLDQRLSPNADWWLAFTASSLDGGASFGANRQAQEAPLYEEWSRHQDGSVFIGDYIGVASTNDRAIPIFPGNGVDRAFDLGAQHFRRADAYVALVAAGAPAASADADAAAAWRGPVESREVGDVPFGTNDPLHPPFID